MTTPSSILACEIPWTEELGTLQCVGLQKRGVAKAWGCTRAGYGLAIKQQHQGLWNDHVLCCAVLFLVSFNCIQSFATLWTIACQIPLSRAFSR